MASDSKKRKRSHYSSNSSMNNHKKNNYQDESDNASSTSTDSQIVGSQNFIKQRNANKHRKKSYALKRIKYNRLIDNDSHESNTINPVVTSSPKKTDQQEAAPNFKPCINKVIEEFKQIFSKFVLQLNKLEMKHFDDEIITEDDAENIIFIMSCIISKMKEELTNYQQKLNSAFLQQSMKSNCKIVSNLQSGRSSDIEDLQMHSKSSSGSDSTYNKIISTNRPKTSATLSENSRYDSDVSKNKSTTPSRSSKENSTSPNKVHNNNSSSHNPQDAKVILHKVKDTQVIKKSANNSVLETSITESNVLNLEALKSKFNKTKKDLPFIEKDLYTNNFANIRNPLDDSSDVDSTCSTVALGYSRKKSMQDDKSKNTTNTTDEIHRYNNRSRSPSVELSTSLVQLSDTIPFCNSDSNESLIMIIPKKSVPQTPKYKIVNHSQNKKTSPVSEMNQLISKYPAVSIVRSNLTRKTTRNDNKIDKLLTMNCRVVLEKLVLPNRRKPNNK